jgi:hypothetical protein
MNVVVRVPAGKVFRVAIGPGIRADKHAVLAGWTGFPCGVDSHINSLLYR